MKFKIGDMVRCIKDEDFQGDMGIITEIKDSRYNVDFYFHVRGDLWEDFGSAYIQEDCLERYGFGRLIVRPDIDKEKDNLEIWEMAAK